MRKFLRAAASVLALGLAACASTPPQNAVELSPAVLTQPNTRVAVVMTRIPKVDTTFPGAGCLLCIAAASVANGSLTTYTQTLSSDELAQLGPAVTRILQDKGVNATYFSEPVSLDKLPDFPNPGPNRAKKDVSSLRSKYNADRMILIGIFGVGMVRTYSSYFPTSDPKAFVAGVAYLVNLNSNEYEWYTPLSAQRAAEGAWDEPPKFPGLTNAYFQVVESTKDAVLEPLRNFQKIEPAKNAGLELPRK